MIIDSLDDLESFDCRDLVPKCSHGSVIVTSTQAHAKDVFKSQGLEIGKLEIFDGCKMLLDGVGAEADLKKGITLLQYIENLSDHGESLRISNRNCQSAEWSSLINRTGEGHDQTRNVGQGLSWSL